MKGRPGVKGTRGKPGRPGFLSDSVSSYEITGTTLADLKLTMRINSPIAKIHEEGRTFVAKTAKFTKTPQLTIPFEKLTPAGWRKARRLLDETKASYAARLQGERLFKIKEGFLGSGFSTKRVTGRVTKSALKGLTGVRGRSVVRESLFVVRMKSGKLLLGQALPKATAPKGWGAKRVRLWFHLTPKAVVPPRLEFFATWNQFQPQANKMLVDGVKYAIQNARRKGGQ